MDIITFNDNISIEPSLVGPNIEETVREKVIVKYKNVCNKRWGYITDIKSITILENIIDRVSFNIFFKLTVEAERFQPKEGVEIDCTIHMCFIRGIICDYQDMKVFVPIATIDGGKYETESVCIKTAKKSYRKGDTIKVSLTNVKYENHKYSAIARLVI